MVDEALADLACRQYGLFSRAQALGLGLTERVIDRRVATGRWLVVARGVYALPGAVGSWRRSLMAACLEAGPRAVVSHEAAGALHGLATLAEGAVVVTLPHGDHQHLKGGRLRQSTDLRPHHATELEGLPVTTPARTVVDLAACVRSGRLKSVVEDALSAKVVSLDELAMCHAELCRPGKRGLTALGRIIASLGPGPVVPASALERRLRKLLAEGGLPPPVCEHELPWDRSTPGRVDLAYPRARVVLEADSRRWHTRERDFEVDRRRDRAAQLAGWDVYRFTWDDLRCRPEEVTATVRRALRLSSK